MDKKALIQEILRCADEWGGGRSGAITAAPLKQFGEVWWANGQWHFSEEHAEIAVYTAKQASGQEFGHGEFEVFTSAQPEVTVAPPYSTKEFFGID